MRECDRVELGVVELPLLDLRPKAISKVFDFVIKTIDGYSSE